MLKTTPKTQAFINKTVVGMDCNRTTTATTAALAAHSINNVDGNRLVQLSEVINMDSQYAVNLIKQLSDTAKLQQAKATINQPGLAGYFRVAKLLSPEYLAYMETPEFVEDHNACVELLGMVGR